MINTLTPGTKSSSDPNRDKVLEQLSHDFGRPEEKQREAVKKMGKDEFFKLLINQIQHQDPLKPYDNEQMAAQMAQFTSLEQMVNVNTNLEKLQQAQLPLQNMGAANLIGKFVTTDSSHVQHAEGKYSQLSFELPQPAAKLRVTVMNDRGEMVREFEQTNVKQGPVTIDWDGKKTNNILAPSGTYIMQITAIDDRERPIVVKTTNTQVVRGVGFEGKDTVLYTGDLNKPTKMLLRDVTRIIDASQNPGAANGNTMAGPGGMQIGGLENVIKPPEIPEDKPVPGAELGQNSKFSPVDIATIRKMQEKPEYAPPPNYDEQHRAALEGRPDLSGANLAAQDAASGRLAAAQAQAQGPSRDEVNQAAAQRGYSNAARKSVPSGADFSTAGKLTE